MGDALCVKEAWGVLFFWEETREKIYLDISEKPVSTLKDSFL
jgi:hypothetical protein